MLNTSDVLETIRMIQDQNLDIRTITMGISLLDCADSNIDDACEKIYQKVTRCAKDLVKTGEALEMEYGIPIINKRISVTPIAMLLAASGGDPVKYAHALERAACEVGVNFIGGFSALVHKGFAAGDEALISAIPDALAATEHVCSSVNVGSTKSGINLDAIRMMGQVIRRCAEITANRQCVAASKLVVFCNAPEDNPFMAGAFHGAGEPDCVINVGVSGPGVVRAALAAAPEDLDITGVAELIKKTAFKITRMGQLIGSEASKRLGVPFGIVDLSLAPTPAVGDSVAHILEEIGLEQCGACGTTACLAMLNDAVKKGGVMASSSVGGLSGAFIPVSEDAGMIDAAHSGALCIEKLEAMTAVCSVGLDMIAIPGDTPAEVISAIIADEAAIGMVNSKTTAVRVIPAVGLADGEELEFGGLFGTAPIMKVNTFSPARFINRGGHIPAPIQAL
ncbi:MAG: PFL family protein, partial [Anaerotruncus rubiinfantis]